MPIEGTLKTFDVPTILQMIYSSQKTGILVVKKDKNEHVIMFGIKDGHVYAALEKIKGQQKGIIDYLYEYGYLSYDQIKDIEEKAKNLKKKPEEILFAEQYINEGDFKKSIESKILELMATIVKWGQEEENGTYHFEDDLTMNYHKGDVQVDIDLGFAVFESARRVDEIKNIETKIPSDEIILETKKEWDAPSGMDDKAEAFFKYINGENSIREIARKIHIGRYRMLEIVNVLLSNEYVNIKREEKTGKIAEKEDDEYKKRSIDIKKYLAWVAISMIVITNIIASIYLNRYSSFVSSFRIFAYSVPYTLEEKNLETLLNMYYFNHMEYPKSLNNVSYLAKYANKFEYKRIDSDEYTLKYREVNK